MKKHVSMLLAATFMTAPFVSLPTEVSAADYGRQVLAAKDGWASYTGTTGGSTSATAQVYTVTNRKELVNALGGNNTTNGSITTPKIIYVKGTINLSVDDNNNPLGYEQYRDPAYTIEAYVKQYDPATWGKAVPTGTLEDARLRSQKNQAARVVINVGSNITLIGLGTDAKIVGGNLMLKKSTNVIIRNITFQDSYDYFPQWDPTDGSTGNWNSQYDNITLDGATNIWIDHCSFNDGSRPDSMNGTYYGREFQHHDGLLDAKNQADLITVSYNHFSNHGKTNLIGSSDSTTADAGKLRITFHHNYYQNVVERAPRVRYGQIHLYNNYYNNVGNTHYIYSIGVGYQSKIYAQNNYFDMNSGFDAAKLISVLKGTAIYESGTMLNGTSKSFVQAYNSTASTPLSTDVGWTPTLYNTIDPTSNVPTVVKANAGAGKLL
ncbi:pectate lyase family protein [Brevibacillus dissolubilis]|uniref:pectate lyase family protein n=1 Tax=Brevibacillus dissolubilis TaxID=1844116 RepID=UPI001116CA13|nr:pectate lyase [Brevibacillus dissolubilis]